jgi:hypothetical protein
MLGLESCVNLTDIEKEEMWKTLKGEAFTNRSSAVDNLVGLIVTRAKYNGHRHYEIYAIDVEQGITREDLVEMFNSDPQSSADLIRTRGRKIYSDRYETNKVKIK